MTFDPNHPDLFRPAERFSLRGINKSKIMLKSKLRTKEVWRWLKANPLMAALAAILLGVIGNILTPIFKSILVIAGILSAPAPTFSIGYENLPMNQQLDVDLGFQLEHDEVSNALRNCNKELDIAKRGAGYLNVRDKTELCSRLRERKMEAGACIIVPAECHNARREVLNSLTEVDNISVETNRKLRNLILEYTGKESDFRRNFVELIASENHSPYLQSDLYYRWAMVENAFGNYMLAHQAFVRAATLQPDRLELVRAAHASSVKVGDIPNRKRWLSVLLEEIESVGEDPDIETLEAMFNVSRDAYQDRNNELSLDVSNRAIELYAGLAEPWPETLASLLNARATAYEELGQFEEAEDDYRQVISIRREIGTGSPELKKLMSQSYMNLSQLLMLDPRRLEEALQLAGETIGLRLTGNAKPDMDALSLAYHSRAKILTRLDRTEEASVDLEEGIRLRMIMDNVDPAKDRRLLSLRNSKAMILLHTDPSLALTTLSEIEKAMIAINGLDHPAIASIKINKSKALRLLGKNSDALEELEEALRIRRAKYATNFPKLVDVMLPLSEVYGILGKCNEKSKLIEEVDDYMQYGMSQLSKFTNERSRIGEVECK